MTLFLVMAANLRLMQTFTARQDKAAAAAALAAAGHRPAPRATRKPRMHTRLRHGMRKRIDARAGAPPGR
jgi:hypothetical protein